SQGGRQGACVRRVVSPGLFLSEETMNDHVNPRAVAGGNNPPLAERIAMEAAPLKAEVEALAARANALPKTVDDMTAEKVALVAPVAKDANDLVKRIEKQRVEVKQPFLDGVTRSTASTAST